MILNTMNSVFGYFKSPEVSEWERVTNPLENLAKRCRELNTEFNNNLHALYYLLEECYRLCSDPTITDELLLEFYQKRNYKFYPNKSIASKIVTAVFGNIDKSRKSTYTFVVKTAFQENIDKDEFVNWLVAQGGIQRLKTRHLKDSVGPKINILIDETVAQTIFK